MNRYKKSRLVVVVSILSVFSLSLLFLTVYQGIKIPFVSDGVRQTLAFFDGVASKPTQFLSKQKDYLNDLLAAYKENQELKSTLASLENSISEMDSLKNENESLRQNLQMKESYADKDLISALVSVRSPNSCNKANAILLSGTRRPMVLRLGCRVRLGTSLVACMMKV